MLNQDGWGALKGFFQVFKDAPLQAGKKETYVALAEWARASGEQLLALSAEEAESDPYRAEADFNRMCIGPGRLTVPPYESVWRTGTRIMNNRFTEAVRHSYAEAGLVVNPGMKEMPDFFGNELEFLYYLTSLLEAHKKLGHEDVCDALEEAADRFWAEHLGHWATKFLAAIEADARATVWKEWARVLSRNLENLFANVPLSSAMTGLESVVAPPATFEKRN
ncbi:MAG: molecular chaperone TorD family protein [Sutterellaceae bacterium]|nr:molecular chaperone TorD family protein [Sutterellaceae bacterium]MDD7442757.1 molecular chaperone TorD family protein [Sutterellaceae bacterium]MDY2867546.1 molecular chaperone TorD family protein [Mesosutterella sp.]